MKKLFYLIFLVILTLSFTACSNNQTTPNEVVKPPTPSIETMSDGEDKPSPEVKPQEETPPVEVPDEPLAETQPDNTTDDESIELTEIFGKNLDDFEHIFSGEATTYVSEFDGSTINEFKDIQLNIDDEGRIVSIFLTREDQEDLTKYSFKGQTFENTNKEILDALGDPLNGNQYMFTYSDDLSTWMKLTFGDDGELVIAQIFYGIDQGDRNFEW